METEEKMSESERDRSGATNDAVYLLNLQFFSPPHALVDSGSLYTLDEDNGLQWAAVEESQLAAPALPGVFVCPYHESAQPTHIEKPVVERP